MSDQERIELQMVQGYQDRLTYQRRAALQMQVEHYKRERAREALKVAWRPPEPQYSRRNIAVFVAMIFLFGIGLGVSAAWLQYFY
jgi:hypothetical protein